MITPPTESQNNVQVNSSISPQNENSPASWLRSLDEIEGTDLPLVGGKAFRLAILKQHGFNIPSGLVLTTRFFETQIHHAKLTPLWAGSPDIAVTAEALKWLADTLKMKPLASQLRDSLYTEMNLIFGPKVDNFAVRSSVIDEDQHDHTFAGLHLTELGVPRSALLIAITRCWASALFGPAIEYRQTHGLPIQNIRPAVLIQPMLTPTSSGVGFTVNPVTGTRDELIIEAVWGLGDRLVSGEVQPYFYRLSNQPPDYPLLEQRTGDISPPPNSLEDIHKRPLSPKEASKLADQLGQIQALMGEPQDVEWAWQDETLFFLQTRPISATKETQPIFDQEWTRARHVEPLPELPSPFFDSLLERSQNQITLFFKELGLETNNLGPYENVILGRPYLNLTLLKTFLAQIGISPDSFLQTVGVTKSVIAYKTFSIDWRAIWSTRRVYWTALRRLLRIRHYLKESQQLIEEAANSLVELHLDAPRTTLLNQVRQQDRIYTALSTANLHLNIAFGVVISLGSRLISPVAKAPASTIRVLALSGLKTRQDELNDALISLSHLAHHNEEIRQHLLDIPNNLENYDTQELTIPAEFKHDFDDLLSRFGERAIYEMDPGWPRYRDDPTNLLYTIQQYIRGTLESNAHKATPTWQSLTDPPMGINRLLPWRRWLVQPLIYVFGRLLLIRDELDSGKASVMATCRQWDLALGQQWVDQGWLEKPQDIFWLTLEEIERAIMAQKSSALMLSSMVQARKETYQSYANTEMPFNLKESELPSIEVGIGFSPEASADVIVGLPISPGQTRGPVAIVHHPDEIENLSRDNTILVIPSTDPAWLSRLHLASGLIIETGGLLSHGSIIAREYGLPAVANIPRATERFHTGDIILVDGSTGVIQLLHPAKSTLNPPSPTL